MIGVQQKNLVITTNYAARKAGVPKSGFVVELKKNFPDLVGFQRHLHWSKTFAFSSFQILVNGEDLRNYRKFSKNVFELLDKMSGNACPVERLGMDENFIDVTKMVEERLDVIDTPDGFHLEGHHFPPEEEWLEPWLKLNDHYSIALLNEYFAG